MHKDSKKTFIFRSLVNSFHYLYQDAKYFHQIVHRKEFTSRFERVQFSRTALLLYILSLEGLINRAMDHFLLEGLREFLLEREDRFSMEDKWLLLPLLVSKEQSLNFDKSKYPWSHFAELVHLRNDFVHPKHNRPAYYRVITSHQWEPLPWNAMPKDLGVKEKDVVYRNTQIPKDPYAILPEHVDKAKKVVDDTVAELDRLLGGRIFRGNWYRNDQMTLIYPSNAKLSDLPSDPHSKHRKPNKEKEVKKMITVPKLTLEDTKIILEGAEKKAKEMGVDMDIAVVDDGGNLLGFYRMDRAKITSIDVAINKAFTAAGARKGTHEYAEIAGAGGSAFGIHVSNHGRFMIFGGGLPIFVDGHIVGGIGCSSGSVEEDRIVAQAGIDALLKHLKKS